MEEFQIKDPECRTTTKKWKLFSYCVGAVYEYLGEDNLFIDILDVRKSRSGTRLAL